VARRLIVRFGLAAVAVFGVIVLTFILQYVIPGDPAKLLAPRAPSAAVLQSIRDQLHLDRPMLLQFAYYLGGLLHGNLGQSYVQREPVVTLIAQRLPATGMLALAGVVCEMVLGTTLGILAALKPSVRRVMYGVNLLLLSTTYFVLGLVLLLVFGFRLGIAPVTGGEGLPQLVLPAITLGLIGLPWYAQIVQDAMKDALSSSYVRTAMAKGLSERRIVMGHVIRNVLSPVVTMTGLDLGAYLSGVVIVETVFGWPGMGKLAVDSMSNLDRPVVMGTVLVGTIAVVSFNILADVVRWYIDPRTRIEPA
jgi:ABC-type dipeptide/oligopeptide/nickel transport system permease component